MKLTTVVSAVIVVAIFTCGSIPAMDNADEGLDLARLSGWDIVVADDAIASEIYAAEEFQEFFSQASGVKLPIVHKIERWDKHVFVGPGKLMQASPVGFGVENLGPEDLQIVVRDDNIAIAGGRPRGTLYGVYTFLEDYLGVRFLTHDHTHVPPVGEQRVIGPVDRVYRPPFANLRLTGYKTSYHYPIFGVRTRNNGYHDQPRFGGTSPFGNTNHSFYRQVPYQKYGKDHPEYFGLWDWTRRNHFTHTHLCLTNAELLPIVTDAVLKEIERATSIGRKNFSVSQNDTIWQYCQCEECTAVDKREESHMGALLDFVNKVADEVAKTHPDVFIGTLSYGFSRKPPKTIRPRDNVQINLCSIETCQLHPLADPSCPRNIAYMQDLRGWSKICRHLYAWTYNRHFHDFLLPYPNLFTIKPNINTLVIAGVEGVFMQCSFDLVAELSDLRNYLINRLLWNPDLDDRAVINEFLDLHYGKAAPPIRRFIDMTHKHYKDAAIHHTSLIRDHWDLPVDESVAKAGLGMFSEAMKLAENDEVKERVEKASICGYRAAIEPIWRLNKDAAIDPALAEQMQPLVEEFFRLCDDYGIGGHVAGARERIEGILGTSDPAGK